MTSGRTNENTPEQRANAAGGSSENHVDAGLGFEATHGRQSPAVGALRRDQGIARANANGDNWWRSCFDAGIAELAATGREHSVEDVFDLGVPMPDHPNRVGAALKANIAAGVIRPIGYRPSRRPSRHAGVVRVWVGVGDAA